MTPAQLAEYLANVAAARRRAALLVRAQTPADTGCFYCDFALEMYTLAREEGYVTAGPPFRLFGLRPLRDDGEQAVCLFHYATKEGSPS